MSKQTLTLLAMVSTMAGACGPSAQADPPPSAPSEAPRAQLFTRSSDHMGTRVSLSVWTDDAQRFSAAAEAVFGEFRRIDERMSSWRESSEIVRLNLSAGGSGVRLGVETFAVLRRALDVSVRTGGAFDITVGAFRGLWKFDQDLDGSIPTAAEVQARLPLVDYRKVTVNPATRRVRLPKGMRVTLGGIAKGYALDQARKRLEKLDLPDYILQAGGDLYVAGRRGPRRWKVGIRDPRGSANEPFAVIQLADRTFSTSGDYERGFVRDQHRYHHILDPKTGHPAKRSRSVTVMSTDAITADAWSTALFVLGPVEGMALVEKTPGIEAVFVGQDNTVHVSSGLRGRLHTLHPPTGGI